MLADEDSPACVRRRLPASSLGRHDGRAEIIRARSAPARASAGTSTTPTCSTAPSASSGPATARTSSTRVDPGARRRRGEARSAGARVADIGCGHGASTILMAQAYPALDASSASTTTRPSIEAARKRAARRRRRRPRALRGRGGQGLSRATATTWSRSSTACTTWAIRSAPRRHVAPTLAPDGTWLLVEPFADDRVEDNLNPVGRVFYSASTLICTPASLSQDVALGARRAGGRGPARRGRARGRLQPLPSRHRDAVTT